MVFLNCSRANQNNKNINIKYREIRFTWEPIIVETVD